MLSKLSVKKPMTVFVCVVIVIVLGIVSFTRMTPDLLPNLDFPYEIIMTTYIGQTPETVETVVTKPLEQSIATIDGVKEITSNSADSYSVVMIQFEDGTNMDTATIDVRSSLDTIKDKWPEEVGSPFILKINPTMLPVGMTAVDYEGKNQTEISDFVNDTLINKLEGIDGVASVSAKGILTQTENVVISQDKVDRLNRKIADALDLQFADAEDKLDKAKAELNKNLSAAEDGAGVISSAMDEITNQQDEVANQLADAQSKADNGKSEMLSAKMQLLDQKSTLTTTKQALDATYSVLLSIKDSYNQLIDKKNELVEKVHNLSGLNDEYKEILAEMEGLDPESEEYKALEQQIENINETLKPYHITVKELSATIELVQKAIDSVNESLKKLEETLESMGISVDVLDNALKELSDKISQINNGIKQIDDAIKGLDENTVTVNDALATISKQQSSADFKMSSAMATLTAKQSEASIAVAQLNSAQAELNKQADTLTDTKKKAVDSADMNNTVTLETIANILKAQNFSMPAGYVADDNNNKYMIRVGDEISSEDDMKKLSLFDTGIDGIGVVTLEDVADVFMADNSDEVFAKINGRNGVVLSFTKQSDTATSTACDNIKKTFDKLEDEYEGLHFTNLYNQGKYINIVVNSVLQNLLMGAVLAIIILFIFLRDIKPTVIVAFSIPISVIFAIVLMYFSGISLNMISLSGLAIGVGMLVDNSVVVIENIYRLRSLGYSPVKAALNGAKQVAGAIAASTLTTICVFFPIVFVDGITRQLFVDMALTIAYSLLASLIIALTIVPAMSQRMLKKIKNEKANQDGKIKKIYEKSLRFVLSHKVISLVAVVALLVASGFGAVARGFSFMPPMSSTSVSATITLDKNATFEDTIKCAEQVNDIVMKYEEFDTAGVMIGSSTNLMGISAGTKSSDVGNVMAYCVLNEKYTKQSEEISERLEKDLEVINGTVTIGGTSTGSMSTLLGDGSIQVTLFGNDLDTLKSTAEDIATKLEAVDGIDETDSGVGATSPELKVSVNKQKAAEKGLTVAQVFQQVNTAISNEKTSTTLTNENGDSMDVVIIKDESNQFTSDNIAEIPISYTTKDGDKKSVRLASIADITNAESMNIINREDQRRYIQIKAIVNKNTTTTQASANIKSALKDYELPSGCSIKYAGSDETTMETVGQLMLMMLLGVILIYLIMVAQFQSLKSPFIIMFTIPLAFTGGFLGLLITGFDVSVISLIGFIMLCGIIVNNGIVLVDYINQLRRDGMELVEAIVDAGKTRMRPIFITALTTVLGLSVMALGIGTGSEMMQPIAIVCIGGLLYATIMTLFIVPVIYSILNKKDIRKIDESELIDIDE